MIVNDLLAYETVKKLIEWLSRPQAGDPFHQASQCASRDLFQAKLDNLFQQTQNSLLAAVCGEIGNNSFDHNLGSWRDIAGVSFDYSAKEKRLVFLADRGQGVRQTLSRIIPNISSDVEAIRTAFTKVISGRSPEQRGNGLKFVAAVVGKNNWRLYFQSGKGYAEISGGNLNFGESTMDINGCLAVLQYN